MRHRIRPMPFAVQVATVLLALVAWSGPTRAADAPPAPPVLHLASGGYLTGEPADSAEPGVIFWRSPSFTAPIPFAMGGITAVRWTPPAKLPEVAGDYRFELAGGDVVFGSLVKLDEATAELEVPRFGRLHVDRASLYRLRRRRAGSEMIYSGPTGIAGWQVASPVNSWKEESGQPMTDVDAATISANLGLPAQAVIEFELTWKGNKPDFILAFGIDTGPGAVVKPNTLGRALRFEVWEGDLVVRSEAETAADIAALGTIADKRNRVHLLAYFDQEKGRTLIAAPDGKPLADLAIPAAGAKPQPGVALINVRGDIRLERLQISRWDGTPPRTVEAARSRIHFTDGSIAYGRVERYQAETKEFVLKGDGDAGESRIAEDRIADVFLAAPVDAGVRQVVALFAEGTRIGGTSRKVEASAVDLAVPGVREVAHVPFEGLRSLTFAAEPNRPNPPGRQGVLELDGARLPGSLVGGRNEPGVGCLVWRTPGGATASLRPEASGRIIYVESRPVPAATVQRTPPQRAMAVAPAPRAVVAFNNTLDQLTTAGPRVTDETKSALYLRTGDVIRCEVTAIDEEGVHFRSPTCPGTFVPHARIKAVELKALSADAIKVGNLKRDRMLTLPRMQKGSPPTQLIRSTNGDYLRGRILAMDAKTLQVEIRLDAKPVPRDRVARIIWLHPDEIDPAKAAAVAAAAGPLAIRVQGVLAGGLRLTFRPESESNGVLSGTSDVLGTCRLRLDEVDQLLIGAAIDKAAAQLAYGRWALHNAEEPKFALADGSGGQPGSESPLVGKPAPEFELDLLDGKKFRLADARGQVVVLDFWATWCGPCIQAMPQVERVTKEFADKGVRLVAINLQEAPRDIKAMLERHKLDVTVALDRDGVVAEKYSATAIPQTVIIDPKGGVARLFVGGGNDFDVRLREALTATLAAEVKK